MNDYLTQIVSPNRVRASVLAALIVVFLAYVERTCHHRQKEVDNAGKGREYVDQLDWLGRGMG